MDSSIEDTSSLTGTPGGNQIPACLATFVESTLDGIVVLDPNGRIVYWNPAAEQMFGWAAGEVAGKVFEDLVRFTNEEQDGEARRLAQQRWNGGETVRGERKLNRKDGAPLWVECTIRPVFDQAGGGNTGFVAVYRDITEYKQTEVALKARTEEIETLLQVSPIGFFVAHDSDCRRITGNPAGYRLVGLPENGTQNISKSAPVEEQPVYHVFREGVELAGEDLPMQRSARLGIEVLEDSLELRFEDGSHKFIYAYARPLLGENGKSRGAIAAMLDITEWKRTEEQLAQSNQKLQDILASIQDDFYVLDRNWNFVYASKLFTSKIGKEPEDFIGNNIWKMFPKHVGTILEENFRAAMEKRQVRRFEIGGKYTNAWYRMTAFPSTEGITVLGTDITEQKRAEEQLRYQAALLSNVNDAIVASDAQYRITAWNSAAESLYGWKEEEVLGCNGLEVVRTEWLENDASEMRRTIAEIGYWRGEATQARKDGSRFPVEISSIVLYDDNRQVKGYVSVNRDITARLRAEAALRESEEQLRLLNETLAQKVNEQTAEMRRLTSNLTKAEQRERHRIAHILHDDLQQRIYAVKMQLAFLGDKLKHAGPAIEGELAETNEQLDQILSLTRNLTVELSPPILRGEGLTQALEWLASMMKEQHGLHIEVQAEESFVIPDEAIQVLLFNCVRELLFNIVKHAGVDRALVALRRSNDKLRIEVRDEGKGFHVAALAKPAGEKIYDQEPKQWSYGLPTLRHQLNLFGGQMEIRSKPNTGTLITITIPYAS